MQNYILEKNQNSITFSEKVEKNCFLIRLKVEYIKNYEIRLKKKED